jgi:Sulfotransferase family
MTADAEGLIERACLESGASDLGPDGWREGFDELLRAMATDLRNDAATVEAIEGLIVGRLVRRLRIEAWLATHPDPSPQPVEGPVVIVGLPRSATTAVHYLLATDPRLRYLRSWELKDPVPPPSVATEAEDARRLGEIRSSDVRHIQVAGGPVEDSPIHEMCFHHGELALPLPSYTAWWRTADHSAAFVYHDRILRMLHRHRPPRLWLLKMPTYLFQLADIAATYPGARFVMTHRDPVVALPSTCSTVLDSRARRVPGWVPDPLELGRQVLDHFADGMGRAVEARRRLDLHRFIDVGQRQVEADAVAVAERIYGFLGLELGAELRSGMASWARRNRRGSRGDHVYRAEDYGLSGASIRHRFSGYLDEFGGFC